MRVKRSDRFLRRSEGQPTDSFDSQTPGLALRVGAQAKSRPLHHWRNELTLGQYPAMSLANARPAPCATLLKPI
jgi:hypothetical protein